MGRNNRQRRAAKKRDRDRRRRPAGPGGGPGHGERGSGDDLFGFGDDDPFGLGGLLGDDEVDGDPLGDDDWYDAFYGRDDPFGADDPTGDGYFTGRNPYDEPGHVDVPALLARAAQRPGSPQAHRAVRRLLGAPDVEDAGRRATDALLAALDGLYEHGWQPVDVRHVAGKKLGSGGGRLIAGLICHDAARRDTDRRAPVDWCDQVRSIRADAGRFRGCSALGWLVGAGLGVAEAWHEIIAAMGVMSGLPVVQTLMDPPSRWPGDRAERSEPRPPQRNRHRLRPAGSGPGDHDPKMLARIRALLAKAESTEFPDEAEALTGKAQSLMSRYAIDEAVLDDGSSASPASGVRARRVHIDSPYASTKVQLLASVGKANRVRVIWLGDVDMATVVGFPLELDLVEMLYTSLLVQATRAMTEVGRQSAGSRSRSFRRAFLLAYAQRIGERLSRADRDEAADAANRATGADLVLARRAEQVDDEFERLFPHTRTMRTTRVDARGWHAGRDAADRASLVRGRLGPDGGG